MEKRLLRSSSKVQVTSPGKSEKSIVKPRNLFISSMVKYITHSVFIVDYELGTFYQI